MAAMAAVAAVGLAVQLGALLLAGAPGAARAAVAAARGPGAALQRLTEVEWDAYHEMDHQGPGTYAFGYDVQDPESGNTQFRQEERHPNGTVTGSYGLVLPDGSVQIVHYTADHLGYRARIETKSQPARFRRPEVVAPLPYAAAPPPAYAAPPIPARSVAPPLPPPPQPPAQYEPVYWLPAPAAAPSFAANYV